MREDNERCGLLKFVPPNFLPVNVLLLEDKEYLSGLRELLPAAQIALLRKNSPPEIKMLCDECNANLIDELPRSEKTFELIIAEDILTIGEDFYLRLLTLSHLLSDSGALLTQFTEEKWTKARLVKLLSDATYKEIHFLPEENFWLVKACKCTAEVAALKEIFTPEVRAELSQLLHRIEYDIDVEKNFLRLMELCEREGIFDEYLSDFINQVVIHAAAKDFIRKRLMI